MKKILISVVLSSVASLSHATQQAFLIQNSGWMEPFYQDQNSQFKPLINGVIQTVAKPDDKIVVSVFNQSNALAKSPKIIYQGAGAKPMLADLQAQQIAYKNDKAYADTDFTEAVVSTITEPFAKQSGIIWIFTNNKNSPNNDAETIAIHTLFMPLPPSLVKYVDQDGRNINNDDDRKISISLKAQRIDLKRNQYYLYARI